MYKGLDFTVPEWIHPWKVKFLVKFYSLMIKSSRLLLNVLVMLTASDVYFVKFSSLAIKSDGASLCSYVQKSFVFDISCSPSVMVISLPSISRSWLPHKALCFPFICDKYVYCSSVDEVALFWIFVFCGDFKRLFTLFYFVMSIYLFFMSFYSPDGVFCSCSTYSLKSENMTRLSIMSNWLLLQSP